MGLCRLYIVQIQGETFYTNHKVNCGIMRNDGPSFLFLKWWDDAILFSIFKYIPKAQVEALRQTDWAIPVCIESSIQ